MRQTLQDSFTIDLTSSAVNLIQYKFPVDNIIVFRNIDINILQEGADTILNGAKLQVICNSQDILYRSRILPGNNNYRQDCYYRFLGGFQYKNPTDFISIPFKVNGEEHRQDWFKNYLLNDIEFKSGRVNKYLTIGIFLPDNYEEYYDYLTDITVNYLMDFDVYEYSRRNMQYHLTGQYDIYCENVYVGGSA